MIFEAEHENVAVKRRPVFLSYDQNPAWGRNRVRAAAWDKDVVVQDPVILVGDLLIDDVLVSASDIIIRLSRVLCRLPA